MWLATAYEQGWFGERNVAEALKWFRKSAAKGNPDAQDSLGQMYEDGEGVKHSYVLAAKWYRKAGEHVPDLGGAGQGRNNLGLLYLYGRGVPRVYVQAYVVSPACWRSIEVRPAHVQPIFCGSTNDRGGD
jgi:hypothetical protein